MTKPIAPHTEPAWFQHAQTFERAGIIERPGDDHHPTILSFFRHTQLDGKPLGQRDETAWCAAFLCACLEQTGFESPHSAGARSFLRWGVGLEHPRIGCIVVTQRKDPKYKHAAHVTLYAGDIDGKRFAALGGNQRNRVCTKPITYDEVIAYRWPKEAPLS